MPINNFFKRKRDSPINGDDKILTNIKHVRLIGDDSDSVANVRPGKATLTTPPAKEKRKNFFKKPVNIRTRLR